MEIFDKIKGFFDPYCRKARLYPALITFSPIVLTLLFLIPEGFSQDQVEVYMSVFMFLGGFYFLTVLARSKGRNIEPKLITLRGGWPTTVLLRHRDNKIDPYTKNRYHQSLQKFVGDGFIMPSPDEESQNPEDADHRYRSATKKLIESRRGSEYDLLHQDNANYGFWRNLLGLKSIAVVLSIAAIALCWVVFSSSSSTPYQSINEFLEHVKGQLGVFIVLASNAVYLLILLLFLTKSTVLNAADIYALALFRTLDA